MVQQREFISKVGNTITFLCITVFDAGGGADQHGKLEFNADLPALIPTPTPTHDY